MKYISISFIATIATIYTRLPAAHGQDLLLPTKDEPLRRDLWRVLRVFDYRVLLQSSLARNQFFQLQTSLWPTYYSYHGLFDSLDTHAHSPLDHLRDPGDTCGLQIVCEWGRVEQHCLFLNSINTRLSYRVERKEFQDTTGWSSPLPFMRKMMF